MKKLLSILLILMLTISLAACGGGDADDTKDNDEPSGEDTASGELKPEDGAKLLIWESEDANGEWLEFVGEKFSEEYGVEVTYEPVGSNDAKTKLPQDGPAGVGADVFAAPHNDLGLFVSSGLIQEIGDASVVKDNFVESTVKASSFQEKYYGYPLQVETYGLFYNKDIFEEAPKSYDDIIAKAEEFNDPGANKYAFIWDVKNAYYSHSFIAGYDGYVFGQNGSDKSDVGLDSEGAIKGGEMMVGLKDILPLATSDTETQLMEGLFNEGSVGAIINGPWFVQGAKDALGDKVGVAPLPELPNGEHQPSFSGTRLLMVSAYTEYPKAAQLFAEFATSEEMLKKRFEMTNSLPPLKSLMEDESIKGDAFVAPFLDQAQYAEPMPSIPQMEYVWGPYGDAFALMWDDGVSPEEALGNAAQTVRDAIEAE